MAYLEISLQLSLLTTLIKCLIDWLIDHLDRVFGILISFRFLPPIWAREVMYSG